MKHIVEKDVENRLVKGAQKITDAQVRKAQWVGQNHCPDRLIMTPHLTVWVEVKAPNKVPNGGQLREHARMRRAGQIVVVVSNFEEVDELLKQINEGEIQ